jgi:hypothetical protein
MDKLSAFSRQLSVATVQSGDMNMQARMLLLTFLTLGHASRRPTLSRRETHLDGTRWWVVTVFWDAERPGLTIPREYLPPSAP